MKVLDEISEDKVRFPRLEILCVFFLCTAIAGQAQQLDRQVYAASGNAGNAHAFTIGELLTGGNLSITSGFQQPAFLQDEALRITDIGSELRVFPVPTADVLMVESGSFSLEGFEITLFGLDGKKQAVVPEMEFNRIRLDLALLPSGTYFLQLWEQGSRRRANYKVLKFN